MLHKIFRLKSILYFLAFLLLVLLIEAGYYQWTLFRFQSYSPQSLMPSPQIWSHRGASAQAETENSPSAFLEALAQGAQGIEIDFYYNPSDQSFRISHDYRNPKPSDLSLDALFSQLPKGYHCWLDFKNIEDYRDQATALKLKKILNQHELAERCFIESQNHEILATYAKLGMRTLYWISPGAKPGSLDQMVELHKIRARIIKSGIEAISGNHEKLAKLPLEALTSVQWFVFTLNEPDEIRSWIKTRNTAVILTDRNLYHLSN